MKGFHPTPADLVDRMVAKLFHKRPPRAEDSLLDPGSGRGAFVNGILRWCEARGCEPPRITAIESDPRHVAALRRQFAGHGCVRVSKRDFLEPQKERFRYVIGNPPYVAITSLSEAERQRYRSRFQTATGRFDLYFLFFEQALRALDTEGRLVFVTPEKFLYVESAGALRELMALRSVSEIHLVAEDAFPGLIAYPTITTIDEARCAKQTRVVLRNGNTHRVELSPDRHSWLPLLHAANGDCGDHAESPTLAQVCRRISAGIATGADEVFVHRRRDLPLELHGWTVPTIAGRHIGETAAPLADEYTMLIPYQRDGRLLRESQMAALMRFLRRRKAQARLRARTCVTRAKSPRPWFAFHETPVLDEILRPKILCKDITPNPVFVADQAGRFVPRHSVYYLVPREPGSLDDILDYLRSESCRRWLFANCQRAANGFLRVQSRTLQRLPIPQALFDAAAQTAEMSEQPLFCGPVARRRTSPGRP